jgi:hypothetical protein
MLIDDLSELPDTFKDGVRGVMLLHRNKDGSTGNAQRKSIKMISNGIVDWNNKIEQLRHLQATAYPNHRIYSSVNSRSMTKTSHQFKRRELDLENHCEIAKTEFYVDIVNRFFSCLMCTSSKQQSYFLIDCDEDEEYEKAIDRIPEDYILADYATKNGRHIISKPFNPHEIKIEVKTDDLIYIG